MPYEAWKLPIFHASYALLRDVHNRTQDVPRRCHADVAGQPSAASCDIANRQLLLEGPVGVVDYGNRLQPVVVGVPGGGLHFDPPRSLFLRRLQLVEELTSQLRSK